jgi:predicted amidohydrolase
MKRTIAAVQTVPVAGDIDANIAEHLHLIEAAADKHPGVVVFPELSLTGYELHLADRLAFSQNDRRLAPLIDAASTHGMTVIAGAPVRIGGSLHIGAFIITPDRAVDIYTKHHLGAFSSDDNPDGPVPPPEASVFAPGTRNPLVALRDSTAAIAICADVGHAEHAQAAADRGANAYLTGSFTIPTDLDRKVTTLQSYATMHSMAVVFSNYGGPTGGLPSAGRSAIWSQTGELLAQLPASGAGVVLATEDDSGWRAQTLAVE